MNSTSVSCVRNRHALRTPDNPIRREHKTQGTNSLNRQKTRENDYFDEAKSNPMQEIFCMGILKIKTVLWTSKYSVAQQRKSYGTQQKQKADVSTFVMNSNLVREDS